MRRQIGRFYSVKVETLSEIPYWYLIGITQNSLQKIKNDEPTGNSDIGYTTPTIPSLNPEPDVESPTKLDELIIEDTEDMDEDALADILPNPSPSPTQATLSPQSLTPVEYVATLTPSQITSWAIDPKHYNFVPAIAVMGPVGFGVLLVLGSHVYTALLALEKRHRGEGWV